VKVQSPLLALNGLYAITPDTEDTETLVARVSAAIKGGARYVQYRNKTATTDLRIEQAQALKYACRSAGALLIINDHVELAQVVDADGVHVGASDVSVREARAALGRGKMIGASCYDQLPLARAAQLDGADYVAFGSFFPSRIKPNAVRPPVELLVRAKRDLTLPIAAIGGITVENALTLINAGASAVAVASALFDEDDVTNAARCFTALFAAQT
jgi:thiamine-phosphate pyrophosphorylase